MSKRFLNLITAFALGAAASSMTSIAMAQSYSSQTPYRDYNYRDYVRVEVIPLEAHNEIIDQALFYDSNSYFDNITIERQLDTIFGAESFPEGNFPENEITWDAELIYVLYQDMMRQQSESDPVLRVPDLPNPYNTSLRGNQIRSYRRASLPNTPLSVGTEFVYER